MKEIRKALAERVQMDKNGFEILEAIKEAPDFNQWMFETISPFCKGNILELGSGTGNISNFFVRAGYHITVSDTDDHYLDILRVSFSGNDHVKGFLKIDLLIPDFEKKYQELKSSFDTVFLLNVLEHLESDQYAIRNCRFLLKDKGVLIVLVPAYTWLYSKADKNLGHYRRYTVARLTKLVIQTSLLVDKGFYFNALGILAWLYGKALKLETIAVKKMKLYNKTVPVAKLIDKICFQKLGLSAIVVAHKESA